MPTNEDIVRGLSAAQEKVRRENNPFDRHIVVSGTLIGAPPEYLFNSRAPHTYCRICGAVFQTDEDRASVANYALRPMVTARRKRWSLRHASTHSLAEHQALVVSGRNMTPLAASRLVPLGIIPVTDMIFDPAVEKAANDAPRLDKEVQSRMEEIRDAVL